MKIPKCVILAGFTGGFWGWLVGTIKETGVISTVEFWIVLIVGAVFIGISSVFILPSKDD